MYIKAEVRVMEAGRFESLAHRGVPPVDKKVELDKRDYSAPVDLCMRRYMSEISEMVWHHNCVNIANV
jgi:hypothetical protein